MTTDGNLRPHFRSHLPDFFWQAVETSGVGRGVPDCHYLGHTGVPGWIEFKGTATARAGLRPEQVAWLARYARMGGRAFIAVRLQHGGGPRKGLPLDDLYIFRAGHVEQLHAEGLQATPAALHCPGPIRRWDWSQVRGVLTT